MRTRMQEPTRDGIRFWVNIGTGGSTNRSDLLHGVQAPIGEPFHAEDTAVGALTEAFFDLGHRAGEDLHKVGGSLCEAHEILHFRVISAQFHTHNVSLYTNILFLSVWHGVRGNNVLAVVNMMMTLKSRMVGILLSH